MHNIVPTSGSSGLGFGGMALAWCGWQQPRRLRSPLSHTVGLDGDDISQIECGGDNDPAVILCFSEAC
jgi:hypothetical protein